MNRTILATAVGVALCGASALHATTSVVDKNTLQAPNFTKEELQQFQNRVERARKPIQNDGLNVLINGQTEKFIDEPDVTGEQVYIVRLKGASVAQKRAQLLSDSTGTHSTLNTAQAKSLSTKQLSAVQSYKTAVLNQQKQVLSTMQGVASGVQMRQQYSEAINGFSVIMTPSEAKRVAELGDVAFVHRSKIKQLHVDAGVDVIEAEKVWAGSTQSGVSAKGEGMVIGILDTGINTDHPSFAATGDDGYTVKNPLGTGVFLGDCEQDASLCNDKLIGVRSYNVINNEFYYADTSIPFNGEDYNGHGSHVASTAVGNTLKDVPLYTYSTEDNGEGEMLYDGMFPELSGVAPHANVIAYQVCWPSSDDGLAGCPEEAILQGIEDAINDGVDVINYSIGGSDSLIYEDPIQMAFLAAREAGISVAAAAGNSGQSCGDECFYSLDNASPWLMNVGASTHDRAIIFESRLTDPTFAAPTEGSEVPEFDYLAGGAVNDTSVTGVIVEAKDYNNVNGLKDQYCGAPYAAGTFENYPNGDPIIDAAGNPMNAIVVCARNDLADPNGVARTDKSDNIKAGGADGFIMWNYSKSDGIVYTAKYSLPTVHISNEDWWGGQTNGFYGLEDWVRNGERGHTITVEATTFDNIRDDEMADWLAPFSSRGPSFYNPTVMAPMVTAPGVDVYAAYADQHPYLANPSNADFAFLSGTSMASPHVAGAMVLMRELHPTWTPAEIQSALMMTAEQTVKMYYLNNASQSEMETGLYRSGSGRINVKDAADTGLVMDESADNFMAANPNNGGELDQLNMPYLFGMSCEPECTWTRTVKATKAGTWKVDHEEVLNWSFDSNKMVKQNGVTISISPKEFTLAEGQEQVITVSAKVTASQDRLTNAEVELVSQLNITEVTDNAPSIHWPMAFKYEHGTLPFMLTANMHNDKGSKVFEGIDVSAASSPTAVVFEPIKAEKFQVTLPKDDDYIYPWAINMDETDPAYARELRLDEATKQHWITVPENSKRLIVEMQGVIESPFLDKLDKANPIIYLGKDLNNDGEIQMFDEIMCVSNHVVLENYCDIANPEAGEYWAVIYNQRASNSYPELIETVEYSVGVVADNVAGNVSASFDGNSVDANMTLDWDMPAMQEGDVYYSALEVGTSADNTANIGTVPLNLVRKVDTVSLEVGESEVTEKTAAKPGERVPYTIATLANNTGFDRQFTFSTVIPEGLSFSKEDVLLSNQGIVDVSIEDGVLTITGTQLDTSNKEAKYNITTNITDEMCRTPDLGGSNPGGYINLSDFGIGPSFGSFNDNGSIEYHRGTTVPMYTLFGGQYDNFHLYDNGKDLNHNAKALGIRGNGNVDLWGGTRASLENIFTMYRTYDNGQETHLAVEASATSGISLAATGSGWGVIEWDDAKSYQNVGNFRNPVWEATLNDSYDFELIFNAQTRYGDNEHELYMAYDNLDFGDTQGLGLAAVQGFKGYVYTYGPVSGALLADIYSQNDLKEKTQDGLVVCYDYEGPESSQFELTVWATVEAGTYGQTIDWQTDVTLEGEGNKALVHQLSIPGHISLDAISDQVTQEETPISGIKVNYQDTRNTKNIITVTGEHVTGTVSGNESGAEITLTPDADFAGSTEVTVTVADIESPADAASTTFTLTVEGVSDAPQAMVATEQMVVTEGDVVTLDASSSTDADGDELTFSWSGPGTIADSNSAMTTVSGLSAGEHTFTVTVSDGENESQATVVVSVVTTESRLVIADISDVTIDEDTTTEVEVSFEDLLGSDTMITAMADNAAIEVMGHESGSMLKVAPHANFNGAIEVTVMVAYKADPSAVAQTTFMVNVTAINDAPVVELAQEHIFVREDQVPTLSASASDLDGDSLTYSWSGPGTLSTPNAASTQVSDLAAGEYVFTVTVSDGSTSVDKSMQVSVTEAPDAGEDGDDDSSSGSLAWLTLIMAGFAGLRRRKR
ncbi:S8 family serine peptidase [Pseudoalteromonas haloplanktis]|uniref:S8 family serine peptidase n=1 Tax=Pseudoalteromonas haloplanktis TaxID=228 RepID=A0ABU1BH04_PSEHA|nr:S8 family serine peptidase [Pseudoalteromonas haloplanktis]MDQ9093204.1 S8 family serine peptidase [Pseudoalteromonas haloplanktis]